MYNYIVCIPSYNREVELKNCVTQIIKFIPNLRAIGVCMQSDYKKIQNDKIYYIKCEPIKRAGIARNLAYSIVRHLVDENTVLVFLDDDCYLESELSDDKISELIEKLDTGILRINANNAVKKIQKVKVNWTGGGLIIKPKVFEMIGMFGAMIARNDMELYIKCAKNGLNSYLLVEPNAKHYVKQKGGIQDFYPERKVNDVYFNPDGIMTLDYIYDNVSRNPKTHKLVVK